jgi:hypothetical protein
VASSGAMATISSGVGGLVSGVGSAMSTGLSYVWKGKEQPQGKMTGFGSDSMYSSGGGSNFYNPPPTYGGSSYNDGSSSND